MHRSISIDRLHRSTSIDIDRHRSTSIDTHRYTSMSNRDSTRGDEGAQRTHASTVHDRTFGVTDRPPRRRLARDAARAPSLVHTRRVSRCRRKPPNRRPPRPPRPWPAVRRSPRCDRRRCDDDDDDDATTTTTARPSAGPRWAVWTNPSALGLVWG